MSYPEHNNCLPEKDIFFEALEKSSPDEREAFLGSVCGNDHSLRRRIEELLANHFAPETFMHQPALQCSPGNFGKSLLSEDIGTCVGRYKLVQKIGEGGMGVVYLAEQKQPVHRHVALKIIKLGMDTRSVIARFEAERQALALMDHPNIARVLDGGATEKGRPFFVMELVQGVPITEFCDKNRLPTPERLRLFTQVCQAVQSAHQKGIIHRDLKPSNVLITLHDGSPVPKVIDFGVAKATSQRLTEKTLFTQHATLIGTPAYMSPEQAEMSGLDVDTRSDIYSLGALLYELLTGTTPFSEERLRSVAYGEMQRIITREEPPRPSTRLCTIQGETRSTIARNRNTQESALCKSLADDLDWIVMKCLEKDRNRRYETANAMGADLHRHLASEPVIARPPSAAYRAQKMIQRNRTAFVAAAAVSVVLLTGIVVSSSQAIRAARAEQQQARERAKAERRLAATLTFVNRVFDEVSPVLHNTIGAAEANQILSAHGFQLMEELRQESDTNLAFRVALGKLFTEIAFSQGWFSGNTISDFASSLQSVEQAISLIKSDSEQLSEQAIHQLARAQMVGGYAALGLLQYDEAIDRFREMGRLAASLTQNRNSSFLSQGRILARWASGSTGHALLCKGQAQEALTYFLPQDQDLYARAVTENTNDRYDLHDLQRSNAEIGLAYKKLNQPQRALPRLRESLRLAELIVRRNPTKADVATFLVEAHSELAELLMVNQSIEEAKTNFLTASNLVENLIRRDPRNVSFAQSRVRVARLAASGLALSCLNRSTPIEERRTRLARAQASLDLAQQHLDELPNAPARNWLQPDVQEARARLSAARLRLDSETSVKP